MFEPNDEDDVLNPPSLEYELEDRSTAVRLLYQSVEGIEATDVFRRRNDLIKYLARLSQVRESPHWHKPRNDAGMLKSKALLVEQETNWSEDPVPRVPTHRQP